MAENPDAWLILPIKLLLLTYLTTSVYVSSLIPPDGEDALWQLLHFVLSKGSISALNNGLVTGVQFSDPG